MEVAAAAAAAAAAEVRARVRVSSEGLMVSQWRRVLAMAGGQGFWHGLSLSQESAEPVYRQSPTTRLALVDQQSVTSHS